MSGITAEEQQTLEKALAALKTLGQGIVSAESKESLIKPFFQVLTDYQKNKTAFVKEARAKHLESKSKLAAPASPPAAVAAPKAKETPDPDLTILESIKALIPAPENAKTLREQLKGKIVLEAPRGWDQNKSPAEKAGSAWGDLLALVNCVSPEPVVVVAVPAVESKLTSAPVSTEGDEEMARRLGEEEKQRVARERQVRSEDEKVAPPPIEQYKDQLIGGEDDWGADELDPTGEYPPAGPGMDFLSVLCALAEGSQLEEAKQRSVQEERARQTALAKQLQQEEIAEQQVILDSLKPRVVAKKKQPQSEPQTFRRLTRQHDLNNHPWWYWLALFLFSALVLVCTAALVFGAISLATHAAFWIVPAAVAGPLTLLAGSVLLLLLVLALHYRFSSSKSLGGGSGEPLLSPGVTRSDAMPANLPVSAVYTQVPSAGPDHPESATTIPRPQHV